MIPLDTKELKHAEIPNIKVEPSDSLFKELGSNTYDFVDLVSELIDNAIANKRDTGLLEISITIGLSATDKENSYFIIRDNAQGIPRALLGKAISPGSLSGGRTLNEHGLGMKQAVAALGELKYLMTKTKDDTEAILVEEFKFGEIFPKLNAVPWESGTEICVSKLKAIVPTNAITYTKTVTTNLGARYRRFLKTERPQMKLNILLLDLDDTDEHGPAKISEWSVVEVKPVYFHPNKRKNEPVIQNHLFKGAGWEATLTFGYAPTDDEYHEMELEPPKQYDPYKVSLQKQGFDIFRNDRIIKFAQLHQIGIVTAPHNSYNLIRGEIDLRKGFSTAITKNAVISDDNFTQLTTQIKELLEEKNYLARKTYPDELPEALVRDRLANHLKSRSVDPKKDVKTEYAVGGLGGYIDVLADGEAWELKINAAAGLEVYQLFAYMDMGGIAKGYLMAPEFQTGATAAVEFIKKNHNKDITLVKTSEYPITQAPSQEERKKYY